MFFSFYRVRRRFEIASIVDRTNALRREIMRKNVQELVALKYDRYKIKFTWSLSPSLIQCLDAWF